MDKKINSQNTKRGFTLVELLVVIAIIAILAAISVVGYTSFIKKAAISNDNSLANQLNRLIDGYNVFQSTDDENSIANILQNNIDTNVVVESQKYDMDIYYNSQSKKFEVMNNTDGTSNSYKNLHYYLSLDTSDNSNDSSSDNSNDNSSDNDNEITFIINKQYSSEFETIRNSGSKNVNLFAKYDVINERLHMAVAINDSGKILGGDNTVKVNLDEIVSASNNSLEVTYSIAEIDLVEYIGHNKGTNYKLDGNILEIYTPGMYQVNCSCQDKTYSLDIFVENIYYVISPSIEVQLTNYPYSKTTNADGTSDIDLTIKDFLRKIYVSDYDIGEGQVRGNKLSENSNPMNSITIILELDGKTVEINMDKSTTVYNGTFESVDLTNDNTISITYRYQGINGQYCYSEPSLIIIE